MIKMHGCNIHQSHFENMQWGLERDRSQKRLLGKLPFEQSFARSNGVRSGDLGKSSPAERASGASINASMTCFRSTEDSRMQGWRGGGKADEVSSNRQGQAVMLRQL